jgi:hypothetical protein
MEEKQKELKERKKETKIDRERKVKRKEIPQRI